MLLPVVDNILRETAPTLLLLHMRSMPLRFNPPPNQPVQFLNLQDLECRDLLDPRQAAACPRLVKLRTKTSVRVLQQLPAETMRSLHVTHIELENRSHEEMRHLVAESFVDSRA